MSEPVPPWAVEPAKQSEPPLAAPPMMAPQPAHAPLDYTAQREAKERAQAYRAVTQPPTVPPPEVFASQPNEWAGQPDEPSPPRRSRKRMVLLSLIAVLLLGAGAGFGGRELYLAGKRAGYRTGYAQAAYARPAPSGAASPNAAPARTPAPTTSPAALPRAKVCVFNFSQRNGWARSVSDTLRGKGFTTEIPEGYKVDKIDHSVLYYNAGYEAEAKKVAEAAGIDPAPRLESRPASFTLCPDGLALLLQQG